MSGCCKGPFVPPVNGGGGGGGGGDGGVAISAGTQSVSTGTVILSNANGITFGMAGSSVVTASVDAIKVISAGTTNATGPGISFADGGGVTFGIAGNTVSASVAGQVPFAISAGTQSASTGTVAFANSNGVTFGMAGSSQITASIQDLTVSSFAPFDMQATALTVINQSLMHINPIPVPNNISFSLLGIPFAIATANIASTATLGLTFNFGIYTRNASTLSLLSSTAVGLTVDVSGNVNTSAQYGIRYTTVGFSGSLSRGEYWFGYLPITSGSSQTFAMSYLGLSVINQINSGLYGVASNVTRQFSPWKGFYSNGGSQTASLPTSINSNEVDGRDVIGFRQPMFWLNTTQF